MTKNPDTLNEMFAASRILPGDIGSWWREQKPCPRCKSVLWWTGDGSPQAHFCDDGLPETRKMMIGDKNGNK